MSDLATRGVVMLSNARLSFPHLAEPQRQKKEDGSERISYSAAFLLPPNDPGFARLMQVVNEMALEKWKEHTPAVLQMIHGDRKKRGFSQGQEHINQKTMRTYDGYEGMVVITAGKDRMPQMIDPQGQGVDPNNTMACQAIARAMYPGCRVNAAVKPWMQDNKFGKGVRFDLVAVQFYADDAPFGEGVTDVSGLFGATAAAPAAPTWAPPTTGMPTPPQFGAPAPAGLPPFLMK